MKIEYTHKDSLLTHPCALRSFTCVIESYYAYYLVMNGAAIPLIGAGLISIEVLKQTDPVGYEELLKFKKSGATGNYSVDGDGVIVNAHNV